MSVNSGPRILHLRLPEAAVVDRIEFIQQLCRGRRVIHAGFWGTEGVRDSALSSGLWLHDRLAAVAGELVGVDISEHGVREAKDQGYEAYVADLSDPKAIGRLKLEPADVLVAGELIEHLDQPGPFLESIQPLVRPSGDLVITTPNAYSLASSLRALFRREVINHDHVALYSWYTLRNVLERHGWQVKWFGTYRYPRGSTLRTNILFAIYGVATKFSPFVSHGLIAVCQRSDATSSDHVR